MQHNWSELIVSALTTFSVALFVIVGFALRRYAGARHSNRPVNESLFKRTFRRSRLFKLMNFSHVSSAILHDAAPLLHNKDRAAEARAFRPLVTEIRRQGEHLLASRRWWHRFIIWKTERNLETKLEQIADIELILRALPVSELTLEDVLAGRFPEQYLAEHRSP